MASSLMSLLTRSSTGGWKPDTQDAGAAIANETFIPKDVGEEIDQAFANVQHALEHAGSKGWAQVYKVLTLSTSIPEQHEHIVRNLKKWQPDEKRATWTEVGVAHLGLPAMRFEIEVEAYDPEGAKKA
jgi:enamine deaminase RidA (YjgF/YER057c/UK114 family)